MIQAPLDVYRIDMKYIRNLHSIDDRVLSVSPQIGKDERPFLGVLVICNQHKYCVPLSKPKKKELLIKELEWCNEHARDLKIQLMSYMRNMYQVRNSQQGNSV